MKTDMSRRELFSNLGRWGALAALAGLVGKLGFGSRASSTPGQPRPNICPACPVLWSCGLPGAVRTKGAMSGPPPVGEKTVSEQPGLCGFQRRA